MDLRSEKALFAGEFINIEHAAQVAGATWEGFQIEYLNNVTRFGLDVKARQIAWSFTAALDAFADSYVNPGCPHIFVSINQDEAREKIRYLRAIIDAADAPVRPKRLLADSQQEVEFDDGSRFISHPCKPVRGKARARVYLDEMAHYPAGLDRQIYLAALPATTKGDGYIRIGSSPFGARGLFWEIATQSMKRWPGFVRNVIPWWEVKALCKDVKMARQIAPELATEDRVKAFGKPALIEIFENMFLEDFQQEYECAWLDELSSWISWDIIKQNQSADLEYWHARSVDDALLMIDDIKAAIRTERIEPALVGGIDVGRKKDLTEFIAVGKTTTGQLPIRLMVSLDRVAYDDQERCFVEIIDRLPFVKVLVDQNGIGGQLAENLERLTGIAEGVNFTNPSKEAWAVKARVQAERGNTPLPLDRDLAYQIHSIRRKASATMKNVFDTEGNEKHHADQFWSWALAISAATETGSTAQDVLALGHVDNYESRWT